MSECRKATVVDAYLKWIESQIQEIEKGLVEKPLSSAINEIDCEERVKHELIHLHDWPHHHLVALPNCPMAPSLVTYGA